MKIDDYILSNFLGKGTFGEVYLAYKQDNPNKFFAAKKMKKEIVESQKYKKYFTNELYILNNLSHKNIIRLESLKRTCHNYYIITDFCNGGSLSQCLEKYIIKKHTTFPEVIVQHFMKQIVDAVGYLHSKGIIHRDLKLDNILLNYENKEALKNVDLLQAQIKIIDFGFAAYKTSTGLLYSAIGTPMNMDLTILKKFNPQNEKDKLLGYDESADIWSLGIICYQMLTGTYAFSALNFQELVAKIEEGNYKVPTSLSKETVMFLIDMLQYDHKKRLTASQLKNHEFLVKDVRDFSSLDKKSLSKYIYGNQMNINIKLNQSLINILNDKKISTMVQNSYQNDRPLTDSQYLEDPKQSNSNATFNKQDPNLIIKEDYINSDKNYIDKNFQLANSWPIPENEKKIKILPPPPMIVKNYNINQINVPRQSNEGIKNVPMVNPQQVPKPKNKTYVIIKHKIYGKLLNIKMEKEKYDEFQQYYQANQKKENFTSLLVKFLNINGLNIMDQNNIHPQIQNNGIIYVAPIGVNDNIKHVKTFTNMRDINPLTPNDKSGLIRQPSGQIKSGVSSKLNINIYKSLSPKNEFRRAYLQKNGNLQTSNHSPQNQIKQNQIYQNPNQPIVNPQIPNPQLVQNIPIYQQQIQPVNNIQQQQVRIHSMNQNPMPINQINRLQSQNPQSNYPNYNISKEKSQNPQQLIYANQIQNGVGHPPQMVQINPQQLKYQYNNNNLVQNRMIQQNPQNIQMVPNGLQNNQIINNQYINQVQGLNRNHNSNEIKYPMQNEVLNNREKQFVKANTNDYTPKKFL